MIPLCFCSGDKKWCDLLRQGLERSLITFLYILSYRKLVYLLFIVRGLRGGATIIECECRLRTGVCVRGVVCADFDR